MASFLAIPFFLGYVSASDNGLLYVCDLHDYVPFCVFEASDANDVGASPHDIDMTVAFDGYRQVVDLDGSALHITPKPWTQGDKLGASETQVTGDLLGYARAFEMMAPLRDAMMYHPSSLVDEGFPRWVALTKVFVDCGIKSETVEAEHTAYGVDDIYNILKDAGGQDTHHFILQFLEEGAIDLVCLMTESLEMNRCDTLRAENLEKGIDNATCMDAAYEALYNDAGTPSTDDQSTGSGSEQQEIPAELPAPGGQGPPPPAGPVGGQMMPPQGGRGGRRRRSEE